jgi:GH15 family glucan-1,4-alpha-glucosidase
MYKPLRDYSLIGNLRTAALVATDGSIDWLPSPTLDAPSVFAAILDERIGGSWRVKLTGDTANKQQQYLGDTNILVTTLASKQGQLVITDFMPITDQQKTVNRLWRRLECREGVCEIVTTFSPRMNFARGTTTLTVHNDDVAVSHEKDSLRLQSSGVHWMHTDEGAHGHIHLCAGESVYLLLDLTNQLPKHDLPVFFDEEFKATQSFWQQWIGQGSLSATVEREVWRAAIGRSLLTLKMLFMEPYNTMAAAPTTSLPELLGGVRNWDYRYNWLRDTAFALQTLVKFGYTTEAITYWQWFIQDCAPHFLGDASAMQCIYGLQGERNLTESTLDHLSGYENSKPVRIGNGAFHQRQWDNYGSVLDLAWSLHQVSPATVSNFQTWQVVRTLAEHVMGIWQESDEGIWEVRGGGHHFVYSKVMCWVALDRAAKLARVMGFNSEAEPWEKERDVIHQTVMTRGWSERKQAFTQSFDSEVLDAAVLRMPAVGFIDAKHPRMLSTIKQIEQELQVGDGLLRRYVSDDGLPGSEGAFVITSFWLIDALAQAGEHVRASTLLQKMESLTNHTGLLSEEIESGSNAFLGNFPQAYSHIGLLNSTLNVMRARAEHREGVGKILRRFETSRHGFEREANRVNNDGYFEVVDENRNPR